MGMTGTLMRTMLRCNISANLIRGIKQLYEKAISEVHEWHHRRMVNNITK